LPRENININAQTIGAPMMNKAPIMVSSMATKVDTKNKMKKEKIINSIMLVAIVSKSFFCFFFMAKTSQYAFNTKNAKRTKLNRFRIGQT
jgi:hypothetical protein